MNIKKKPMCIYGLQYKYKCRMLLTSWKRLDTPALYILVDNTFIFTLGFCYSMTDLWLISYDLRSYVLKNKLNSIESLIKQGLDFIAFVNYYRVMDLDENCRVSCKFVLCTRNSSMKMYIAISCIFEVFFRDIFPVWCDVLLTYNNII